MTQQLTTNTSGYFEARLLNAGTYDVVVEMTGFKTLRRAGVTLSSGQQLALPLTLEIGTIAEEITVTGEAPLLEVTTLRQGLVLDEKKIGELPLQSNMPVLFARFAPGMMARGVIPFAGQGFVGGPTTNATPLGGVGGVDWSIDGATNSGVNRQMSTSPNTDMVQEMRVESTNFTASIGHGTGVGISMMTKAGTNTPRGTVNHQYWTNKLNPPNRFQQVVFDRDPRAGKAYEEGASNNLSLTFGGPVLIPGVINGTNKLFTFVNYSYGHDDFNGKSASPNRTLPRSDPGHNQIAGDFSDLLLLPNPAQYQIYDPLTTRPDPARPGHVIRDPFPNNIIPADRITNPLYKLYTGFLPAPNTNPTASNQQPLNNYYDTGQPDPLRSHVFGVRLDYNHSDRNRFFGRVSGSNFTEGAGDWTYESVPGLHALSRVRKTRAGTGTWTRVAGDTVIDGQFGANRFLETDQRLGLKEFTPSGIGLPAYMDQFCQSRGDFGGVTPCQLPRINFGGDNLNGNFYQVLGDNSGTFDQGTHYQGQLNVSQVRGSHTLRGWRGLPEARALSQLPRKRVRQLHLRQHLHAQSRRHDRIACGESRLGWAAFMLGIPTRVEAEMTASSLISNHWVGSFFQDTWRVSESVTLNFGLRHEYETGLRRRTTRCSPASIRTRTSRSRNWRKPRMRGIRFHNLRRAPSTCTAERFTPDDPGQTGLSWGGQSMWMPRVSGSWSMNERTVLKAGYGMYYDVLSATNFTPNQTGYSATTINEASVDFGQTWLLGDPKRGISPMTDPFPDAEHRNAFRPGDRQLARRQHRARHPFPGPESQSRASARAAMARQRAARDQPQHGCRDRLQRQPGRSPRSHDPAGLPAGRVVERQQRARSHAAEPAERQRDEPVLHRQLRAAEDVGSGAVQPDGGELVLHQPDHSAASAAASVPPHVERGWSRLLRPFRWERTGRTHSRSASTAGSRTVSPRTSSTPRRNSRRTGPSRNTIASRPIWQTSSGSAAAPHHGRLHRRAPVRQRQAVPE